MGEVVAVSRHKVGIQWRPAFGNCSLILPGQGGGRQKYRYRCMGVDAVPGAWVEQGVVLDDQLVFSGLKIISKTNFLLESHCQLFPSLHLADLTIMKYCWFHLPNRP